MIKRIVFLKETEGCVLCRLRVATKHLYMPSTKNKLIYHTSENGDYLICPWHEAVIKHDWRHGRQDCLVALKGYLKGHRNDEYQEDRF